MLKHFKREFNRVKITFNQKVLVAVSGGIDSMVLWHLMYTSKKIHGVAHVNFSMRGEESDADELLVRQQAEKWNIPYHTIKVDTIEYAKENGLSIQMAARELRYNFFKELKKKHHYEVLATAHHLQDNVETFFINLNRGTGLKGLRGINSTQKRFRPLLDVTKEEITVYAKENGVHYREDKSNTDTKYERNWFRHEVIAPWQERNPAFLKRMKFNLMYLGEANSLLESFIKSSTKDLRKQMSSGYLEIALIKELVKPELMLFYLLSPYDFSEDQVKNLIACIRNKKVGKTFNSSGHYLLVDRKKIFLSENSSEEEDRDVYWMVDKVCKMKKPIKLRTKSVEKFNIKFKKSKRTEIFDAQLLKFPLKLRKWKKGDKMQPLGMSGMKKVSDILVDDKIPLHQKKQTYVLVSDKKIVWLVGIKSDNRFKVTKDSKKVVEIKVK